MNKEINSTSNLLFLDGLRALAASYVMLHHAILQYYELNLHDLTGMKKLSVSFFFQGRLAVDLFIVLSGFCLMLPVIRANYYLKGGSWIFYKRRIIRILPPYYLAMLLSMALIWLCIGKKTGSHWDISIPYSFSDVIAHILLIYDISMQHAAKINHSFWSIAVECRIYIYFPLLFYFWRKFDGFFTLLFSVILSGAIYVLLLFSSHFYPDINLASPGVNPYIVLFVLGMLAADFSFSTNANISWRDKLPWKWLLLISVPLYFVLVKAISKSGLSFLYDTKEIPFGICCFLLLIVCSKSENIKNKFNWIRTILSWQPLVFIGSFAYSLYLIHAPLVQVLSQYIVDPLKLPRYNSAMLLLLLSVVIIIPCAYLFFIFCEKPFMVLGKKLHVKEVEKVAIVNPAP